MPPVSIDLVQMAVVVVVLTASVLVIAKSLFSRERSMFLAAGQWLYLWSGGGVLLLILEAAEATLSRQ